MEIAKQVHHFATGPFNWYLIEEAGALTLVDAGFPGHYSVFVNALRQLGREIRDVKAILLTHAHADHTGFAERVRRESDAPVFIHAADREKLSRHLQLPWIGLLSHAWRPYTAMMLAHATLNQVFTAQPVHEAHVVQDDEILDVPGRPHVLFVPGHTPGEVAFFLPERKVLLSGDTIVTRDLFTGREGQPMLPNKPLNGDDTAARRNLDRMRELGEVDLLPGHGRPWHGRIEEAIALARRDAFAVSGA